MNIRKFILPAAVLGVLLPATAEAGVENPDSAGYVFTDIATVKLSPVRDQNKSGTCWAFSTTSFFEEEILRKTGRQIDLSVMYTVRQCYDAKAINYVRRYGQAPFSQGGSALDVPYVIEHYGMLPAEAYPGLNYGESNHVHGELESGLKGYISAVAKRPDRRLSTAWPAAVDGILDAYFGAVPETFEFEGQVYTPITFAEMLGIKTEDYIPLTSFSHHPFWKPFVLEVSDNWVNGQYYNIPLDELVEVTENAVRNGYPVAWAADVSERGFKWANGVAYLPAEKNAADLEGTELSRWVSLSESQRQAELYKANGPVAEENVTQEVRQAMFDRQETTDDHGMVIVGLAKDQKGNLYFKVQNSWTTNQIYDGFFYVSVPYFRAKTLDIYVNKGAVPSKILKKLNLDK